MLWATINLLSCDVFESIFLSDKPRSNFLKTMNLGLSFLSENKWSLEKKLSLCVILGMAMKSKASWSFQEDTNILESKNLKGGLSS